MEVMENIAELMYMKLHNSLPNAVVLLISRTLK